MSSGQRSRVSRREGAGIALITVLALTVAGAGVTAPGSEGGPDRLIQERLVMPEAIEQTPDQQKPETVSYDKIWRADVAAIMGSAEPPVSATTVLPLLEPTDSRVDLTGIPARVLEAYIAAADRLAREQPRCDLEWPLLAGIGLVESGHGTFGGASVGTDGRIVPEIIGVQLNGAGPVAEIRDTDGGAYDRDVVYDRAVGPMQFIPGTWALHGADADGDGRKNPHDIDDVALGAGRYLCAAGGGSLSDPATLVRAVFAYNNSNDYVRLVLTLAAGYAGATPESLGVGLLPPPTPAPPSPPPTPSPDAPVLAAGAPVAPQSPAAGPGDSVSVTTVDPQPSDPSPATTPSPANETPAPTPSPEPTVEPSPSPSETPPTADPSPSPSPADVSPTPNP